MFSKSWQLSHSTPGSRPYFEISVMTMQPALAAALRFPAREIARSCRAILNALALLSCAVTSQDYSKFHVLAYWQANLHKICKQSFPVL